MEPAVSGESRMAGREYRIDDLCPGVKSRQLINSPGADSQGVEVEGLVGVAVGNEIRTIDAEAGDLEHVGGGWKRGGQRDRGSTTRRH